MPTFETLPQKPFAPQTSPLSPSCLAGRDLLDLLQLSPAEVHLVLETAVSQKAAWNNGSFEPPLQRSAIGIIMEKPSFRTRSSFEMAAVRLGAHPLVMADKNSAFSRGEPVKDTACILDRFAQAIVLRTYEQAKLEEVAQWASVPVVNALTDESHPCQVLADFLTLQEHGLDFKGLRFAYVGDGSNNMANTYLEMAALLGVDLHIACPADYAPDPAFVQRCVAAAKAYGSGAGLYIGQDVTAAVSGAAVVVTDTWTSMGSEEEHDARLAAFDGYCVDAQTMALAAPDAVFLHCLPAHRGEEVLPEVIDGPQSLIYDEAENRLHAQQALLSLLMGVPAPADAFERAQEKSA